MSPADKDQPKAPFYKQAKAGSCALIEELQLDARIDEKPQRQGSPTADKDLWAVIVAAGSGERFGDSRGKQFVEVAGLPLAAWSILAFGASAPCAGIVVVCPQGKVHAVKTEIVQPCQLPCQTLLVEGGATRQESSAKGIAAVPAQARFIAVHDAARPLVSPSLIERVYRTLVKDPELAGAIAARPATDTLKIVEGTTIVDTPDRTQFWYAETPQIFRAQALRAAHAAADKDGWVGTDDASLVERQGQAVACVAVEKDNVKVTLPEDMVRAAAVLEARMWT